MTETLMIVMVLGALSLAYGAITAGQVTGMDAGTARMQEIAKAIQEGAQAAMAGERAQRARLARLRAQQVRQRHHLATGRRRASRTAGAMPPALRTRRRRNLCQRARKQHVQCRTRRAAG